MYDELKKEIIDFKKTKREKLVYLNGISRLFKTKLSTSEWFSKTELYKKILKETSFLDKLNPTMDKRLRCIFDDITEIPKCIVCGKECGFNQHTNTILTSLFSKCCSKSCYSKHSSSHKKPITDKQRKIRSEQQTELRKNISDKHKQFYDYYKNKEWKIIPIEEIIKFVKNIVSKQIKNGSLIKTKQYLENKDELCNIINYTNNIEIRDETNLCRNVFKWSERSYWILNNIHSYPRCKFCQKEIKKFISLKQGYGTLTCKDCVGDKIRFIVGYPSMSEITESINKDKYEIIHIPKGGKNDRHFKIKCKKCGHVSNIFAYNGHGKNLKYKGLCEICDKGESVGEKKLLEFIKGIEKSNILVRDKKTIYPYELDIVIPDKKIAIEFDGLYWHGDYIVDKNYNLKKTELCKEKGYRLIHVFENEWNDKEEIVKSRIRNILKNTEKKIYARQCVVKELDNDTASLFLVNNHIQGSCLSSVRLGLYFKDELVSVMTFGKSRFSKKYQWEMIRFANNINTSIIGGASKLFSYFEKTYKPKSIVSYADRRWSEGNLYEKLGFCLKKKSIPNYWYVKGRNIYNRIQFQKHKLKDKLKKYDDKLSEKENMKNNGYYRIYDCGNLVYVKNYG